MFGYPGKVGRPFSTSGFAIRPSLDINFLASALDSRFVFTRASIATDGLYTDAAGSGYNSFASGIPRISVAKGYLHEQAITNFLLNSDVPATQTTGSLPVATYCLWVIGTGSAAVTAGTATITGAGSATPGTPLTFSVTVAGTATVTVTGSLTRFQVENAPYPTSYVPTAGATVQRQAESLSMPVGSWFSASQGTVWAETSIYTGATNNPSIVTIDDASLNNRLSLFINSSLHSSMVAQVSGSSSGTALSTNAQTQNTIFRVAGTYSASGVVTALSGTVSSKTTLSSGLPTGLTTFRPCRFQAGTQPLNNFLRRLRYYPREMQSVELASVTT